MLTHNCNTSSTDKQRNKEKQRDDNCYNKDDNKDLVAVHYCPSWYSILLDDDDDDDVDDDLLFVTEETLQLTNNNNATAGASMDTTEHENNINFLTDLLKGSQNQDGKENDGQEDSDESLLLQDFHVDEEHFSDICCTPSSPLPTSLSPLPPFHGSQHSTNNKEEKQTNPNHNVDNDDDSISDIKLWKASLLRDQLEILPEITSKTSTANSNTNTINKTTKKVASLTSNKNKNNTRKQEECCPAIPPPSRYCAGDHPHTIIGTTTTNTITPSPSSSSKNNVLINHQQQQPQQQQLPATIVDHPRIKKRKAVDDCMDNRQLLSPTTNKGKNLLLPSVEKNNNNKSVVDIQSDILDTTMSKVVSPAHSVTTTSRKEVFIRNDNKKRKQNHHRRCVSSINSSSNNRTNCSNDVDHNDIDNNNNEKNNCKYYNPPQLLPPPPPPLQQQQRQPHQQHLQMTSISRFVSYLYQKESVQLAEHATAIIQDCQERHYNNCHRLRKGAGAGPGPIKYRNLPGVIMERFVQELGFDGPRFWKMYRDSQSLMMTQQYHHHYHHKAFNYLNNNNRDYYYYPLLQPYSSITSSTGSISGKNNSSSSSNNNKEYLIRRPQQKHPAAPGNSDDTSAAATSSSSIQIAVAYGIHTACTMRSNSQSQKEHQQQKKRSGPTTSGPLLIQSTSPENLEELAQCGAKKVMEMNASERDAFLKSVGSRRVGDYKK